MTNNTPKNPHGSNATPEVNPDSSTTPNPDITSDITPDTVPVTIPDTTPGNLPEASLPDKINSSLVNQLLSGASTDSSSDDEETISLNSPGFNPPSWAEVLEMIKKNTDKSWEEIPENERWGVLELVRAISSRPSPTGSTGLGYNPVNRGGQGPGTDNQLLIATAINWKGLFCLIENEEGELEELRLKQRRVQITCSLSVPPEVIEHIERLVQEQRTQSFRLRVIVPSLISISQLNLPTRDKALIDTSRQLGITPDTRPNQVTTGIIINQYAIVSVVPFAQVSQLPTSNPDDIVLLLNESAKRGATQARELRALQVQLLDNRTTASPDAMQQMDSVQEDKVDV